MTIPMKNPATKSSRELNEFTKYLYDHPFRRVTLRNGRELRVMPWYREEDTNEFLGFCAMDHEYDMNWAPDGTSLKNHDLDIMGLASKFEIMGE